MARTKQRAQRNPAASADAASSSGDGDATAPAPPSARQARPNRVSRATDWRPKWTSAGLPGGGSGGDWMLVCSKKSRAAHVSPRGVDPPAQSSVSDHAVQILHWDPRSSVNARRVSTFHRTDHWAGFSEFAEDARLLSVRLGDSAAAEVSLPEGIPACLAFCAQLGCVAVALDPADGVVRFYLRARGVAEIDETNFGPKRYLQMYPMGILLRWACAVASANKGDVVMNGASVEGENDDEEGIDDGLLRDDIVAHRENIDAAWVYAAVKREKEDEDAVQYSDWMARAGQIVLNVDLRPYQTRAVAWMLGRELGPPISILRWNRIVHREGANEIAFEVDTLGQTIREYGALDKQEREEVVDETPRGGLLCDAMGLGKTVEFLQLIALHRLPPDQQGQPVCNSPLETTSKFCVECDDSFQLHTRLSLVRCKECSGVAHISCSGTTTADAARYGFVCKSCCALLTQFAFTGSEDDMPQSRATLIIVPPTLLAQWQSEVEMHVADALNVVIFEGLHATGYVPQRELLNADVVITTYTALKHDVNVARTLLTPSMSLRYEKKYRPTPTPLLGIRWWRIALDEAQMLGAGASLAVEMASKLWARLRWCVTGTPVAKSVDDLNSILNVLNVGHGFTPTRWKKRLVAPAMLGFDTDRENLKFALRQVMWRTEKEGMTEDELVIPPQQVEFVRVSLNPVEKYHYTRLHTRMRELTLARLERSGDINLAKNMIHCLRQACCHPQVGASGQQLIRHTQTLWQEIGTTPNGTAPPWKRRRLDPATEARRRSKNPLTMGQVLDVLVTKARIEFTDVFRQLVAESNGYAAILLLKQGGSSGDNELPIVEAIEIYRSILRLADKNSKIVEMDKIQRMHVLHNLDEALHEVDLLKQRLSQEPNTERQLQVLRSVGKSIQETTIKSTVENLKRAYIFAARERLTKSMAALDKSTRTVLSKRLGPHVEPTKPLATEPDSDAPEPNQLESISPDTQASENEEKVRSSPRKRRTWWWELAVGIIRETGESKLFLERLSSYVLDKRPKQKTFSFQKSLVESFRSLPLLYSGLTKELTSLAKARQALLKRLYELPGATDPSEHDVFVSGQCNRCHSGTGPDCKHCKSEKMVKALEQKLYFIPREVDRGKRTLTPLYANETDQDSDSDESGGEVSRVLPLRTRNTHVISRAMHIALRSDAPSQPDREKWSSGTRLISEIEDVLGALLGASKYRMDPQTLQEANAFMGHFKALKQEFVACKVAIEAQRNYLASLDEVNMALMRLAVVDDETPLSELSHVQQILQLRREMIPALEVQFRHEKACREADFQTKRGSLVYLTSLKRGQSNDQNSYTLPEGTTKCPICLSDYTQDVAILACAHPFCYDCALELIKKVPLQSAAQRIKCPTCRSESSVDDVNFTVTKPTVPSTNGDAKGEQSRAGPGSTGPSSGGPSSAGPSSAGPSTAGPSSVGSGSNNNSRHTSGAQTPSPDSIIELDMSRASRTRRPALPAARRPLEPSSTFCDPTVRVLGSMSAKLTAIVRVLKTIATRDPGAKALVFSQWAEVLELISGALAYNAIPHLGDGGHSAKEIGKCVAAFKRGEANVLLLPLRRAGAGLNLTEATHVLLVEPSLNPALEAQAVGRVHRIGQTKPTFVHRFVVTDSIEERVLAVAAGRSDSDQSVEERVSVEDVRALFARNERVAEAVAAQEDEDGIVEV